MKDDQSQDIVSLKEYVDRILLEKDKALAAALASAKEAVQVAETNANHWRDAQNEWRAAMSDRDQMFLTKAEFFSYREGTQRTLKEFSDFKEGRANVPADIESLKKDVKTLNTFKDGMSAVASQKGLTITLVISGISLGLAVLGIVLRFLGL